MPTPPHPINVPITRPALSTAEAEAAARVVRSGWLMQGPEVAAFEQEFAAAVNARHAVATANGTAALELALRAAGVGSRDEVITVSHSFIATTNAVLAVGAHPVLVDVTPDTLCIDPERVKHALSPRTRAVLAVHQVGMVVDLRALVPMCRAAGLFLIEDAACALGSEILWNDQDWHRIGRPHGDVACFSFHPRKIITTGEGGMITTGDKDLADRARLLRQHGFLPPADGASPNAGGDDDPDGYQVPAFNLRLTDVAAAIGRVQLARLDAIVAERRDLAARYQHLLAHHAVLAPPALPPWQRNNWQSFPAFLRPGTGWTARGIVRFLAGRGISARHGLTNAHEEPALTHGPADRFSAHALPVSERLRRNTVFLPLFAGLTAPEWSTIRTALDELNETQGPTPPAEPPDTA